MVVTKRYIDIFEGRKLKRADEIKNVSLGIQKEERELEGHSCVHLQRKMNFEFPRDKSMIQFITINYNYLGTKSHCLTTINKKS